ncbi:hypothetical protein K438DRAFT_1783415 [Mycena galopus ATCC 62051]|nr:hypothetical protein K438DRAFT_1783415 [Mycena galopus ATCC 62051]
MRILSVLKFSVIHRTYPGSGRLRRRVYPKFAPPEYIPSVHFGVAAQISSRQMWSDNLVQPEPIKKHEGREGFFTSLHMGTSSCYALLVQAREIIKGAPDAVGHQLEMPLGRSRTGNSSAAIVYGIHQGDMVAESKMRTDQRLRDPTFQTPVNTCSLPPPAWCDPVCTNSERASETPFEGPVRLTSDCAY